ncbi:MAG: response regulator [Acidimicrobiales bacterium]
MIRTLVVDDDFRVASIHSAYIAKIPGFSVVGEALSAQAVFDAVKRHHPDLILLDLYLPDLHGLEVLRRLRQPSTLDIDVIVVTAAQDTASVRSAIQGGAFHYILKPFAFPVLRETLFSYARMRQSLASASQGDQASIDRLYSTLGRPTFSGSVRGCSMYTLEAVEGVLANCQTELTAVEIAEGLGVSRATAQRYLTQLAAMNKAAMTPRYGSTGRPEHRYRWLGNERGGLGNERGGEDPGADLGQTSPVAT